MQMHVKTYVGPTCTLDTYHTVRTDSRTYTLLEYIDTSPTSTMLPRGASLLQNLPTSTYEYANIQVDSRFANREYVMINHIRTLSKSLVRFSTEPSSLPLRLQGIGSSCQRDW